MKENFTSISQNLVSSNPLFYAFLFPALVDGAVTLLGQSTEYWVNLRMASDSSPAYYFLVASPWLYVFGAVIWFVVWYFLFKKLNELLSLFFSFLFIAGHSWGSTSWLWKMAKESGWYIKSNQISIIYVWIGSVFYFSLVAGIASFCFRVFLSMRKK